MRRGRARQHRTPGSLRRLQPLDCIRCGREERADEKGTLGALLRGDTPDGVLPVGTTLWWHGPAGTVCPECQTTAERVVAVETMRAIVERWLAEPREAEPLAPRVEAFRRGLPPPPPPANGPSVRGESEPGPLADARHGTRNTIRCTLSGAFSTSPEWLDRVVGTARAAPFAAAPDGTGWSAAPPSREAGTYPHGGGLARPPELVLGRYVHAVPPALASGTYDCVLSKTDPSLAVVVTARAAHVELFDGGVGTFSIDLTLAPSPAVTRLSRHAVCQAFNNALYLAGEDPATPVAQPLVAWCKELARTVDEHTRAILDESEAGGPPTGRVLWIHPVFFFDRETPEAVRPPSSQAVPFRQGEFEPGISWSAARIAPSQRDMVERLTLMHWALHGLLLTWDAQLGALLAAELRSDPPPVRPTLSRLRHELEAAQDRALRVHELRGRFESDLVSRGGNEVSIWQTLEVVARTDELSDAVDRKSERLERAIAWRLERARSRHDDRTATLLQSLSALTILTVAVAVLQAVAGPASTLEFFSTWLRVSLVAVALVLVLGASWWLGRGRGRRGPS